MNDFLNENNNFHDDEYEESFAEKSNRERNLSDIRSIPLSENARKFIKEKSEKGDVVATTIIKERATYTLKKEFVIVFTENFFRVLQSGINQSEMKILSYIIDQMEYGNLISISQASIAVACNMKKSNVSICFKKLIEKNILIKNDVGNIFVNSNIISKGLSNRMTKENYDNLKIHSQKETLIIENSF